MYEEIKTNIQGDYQSSFCLLPPENINNDINPIKENEDNKDNNPIKQEFNDYNKIFKSDFPSQNTNKLIFQKKWKITIILPIIKKKILFI